MAKKSLLNKDLADLNNDGKLSSYEKRRGMAIEESMQERKPYKFGKLINKASSKFASQLKEAKKIYPDIDEVFQKTRPIKPKEANELYQFLVDKIETGADDPAAYLQSLALDELKMISKGDTARQAKLFDVFLDEMGGDITDIDRFLDVYIKVPTKEGSKLLSDLPMTSRAINNQGGLLASDDYRMGFAEGQNDAEMQNYRIILAGLRQLPENELPQVLALAQEGKSLPEQYMVEEKAGVVMNPIDAQKNHPDLFMKALNFLQEPREQQNEGGEMKMLPDEEMEQNFIDFVVDEALSDEEKSMLEEQLEANPELSVLFDKVIERASEFTGAGPVDGPGTGTSDDIPARLSDGEFVFTAKAVEQIGADNLMKMMKEAEAAYDAGGEREAMQEGGEPDKKVTVEYVQPQQQMTAEESLLRQMKPEDESQLEIKKSMMSPFGHVRS